MLVIIHKEVKNNHKLKYKYRKLNLRLERWKVKETKINSFAES